MICILSLGCSSDKNNSQDNDLFGKWKLISFVDEKQGTILTESDFENSNTITIDFKEDFTYDGQTGHNIFSGDYEVNESETVLILGGDEGIWTEVGETEWGNLFFDTLNLNYNPTTQTLDNEYNVANDALKIYYADKEYMEFVKVEP